MLNKQKINKRYRPLTAVMIMTGIAASGMLMSADHADTDSSAPKNMAETGLSLYHITETVKRMPLHEKVCQMFVVRPEELTNYADYKSATAATCDCLKEYPVGGLVYSSLNLSSQSQVRQLISDTKAYAAENGCNPLFYCVDEEGGNVARCAYSVHTTAFSPMYNYRNMGTVKAYANARTIGGDIGSLGFNVDFAPVADVWSNPQNTVIGTRAYSDSFTQSAELLGQAVKGFRDSGVYCTLKHFPGHGDTVEDSHDGMAVAHKSADDIRDNEYLPFKSGIDSGAEFVMVGHITVPAMDDLPASLSEKIVTGELREKLGFEGIIITDALGMGAIINEYGSVKAAVMAVEAGNDILLSPQNLYEAVEGVEDAVKSGRIPESRIDESVIRILSMKSRKMEINLVRFMGDVNNDGTTDSRDASAVLAEYANISANNPPSFDEEQKKAADVNGDGVIDARDASAILSYYAVSSTGSDISQEEFFGIS